MTNKKEQGAKKALVWKSVRDNLVPLVGQDVTKLSNKDQIKFLIVLGQLLDIIDESSKIKPL